MSESYHYLVLRRLDFVIKRRFQWGLFQKRLFELGEEGYRLIDRFLEEGNWVMIFSKLLSPRPRR